MTDPATLLAVLLGFALIVVGASRLGAGTTLSFQGLWGRPPGRDWPHGVQEADAPRFAVAHLDGLRAGTPVVLEAPAADDSDEPGPEILELDVITERSQDEARMPIRAARTEWVLR